MADRDEVLSKLAHLRRRAYQPAVEAGDGVATDSKLGGTPYLPEGADWPTCDVCGEPMPLVVQLNPSQMPEPLRKEYGGDLIQLFYCSIDDGRLCRSIAVAGDAAAPGRRPASELGPLVIRGWSAVDDYPVRKERRALGVDLDADEDSLAHELTRVGEKLSGWPFWIQRVEYPSCRECGKTMRLVFQVDSEGELEVELGDQGVGHITQCPVHKNVLAFEWACG